MDTPRTTRYLSLDVWRGLACLMVVLDHAGVAVGHSAEGGVGIDHALRRAVVGAVTMVLGPPLFFVISGYCIAASVESLRAKGKPPLDFLVKRLWRTFPPYWTALVGFALIVGMLDLIGLDRLHAGPYGLALPSLTEMDAGRWLGNLTLTETWRHCLVDDEGLVFTRVAWSLCYQEQFYLVCFLVAMLAPRRLFGTLAALTGIVVFFRVAAWDAGATHRIAGTFPDYWHEFAVGLAVYWHLNLAPTSRARRGIEALMVAMIGIGLVMGLRSTAIAAGFGLVMIGLRPWDGRLAASKGLAPIRACGRRCYSIYLAHLPICSVGNMALIELGLSGFWARALVVVPLTAAGSLIAGWVFHRYVESRFVAPPSVAGPWASSRRPALSGAAG